MYGLILLLTIGQTPPPPAAPAPVVAPAASTPTPASIKLEANKRSGYALVTASADKQQIKQLEWIVTASSSSAEVTYDELGTVLIVSMPKSGSVLIYGIALLADGTLATPSSLELSASANAGSTPPSAGNPAGPTPAGLPSSLRVILVVNLASLSQPEKDLLNSDTLKQGLAALGHRFLYADIQSTAFQATLAAARKQVPDVPTSAPMLFMETADRKFVAASQLTLGPDAKVNEQSILAIFKKELGK